MDLARRLKPKVRRGTFLLCTDLLEGHSLSYCKYTLKISHSLELLYVLLETEQKTNIQLKRVEQWFCENKLTLNAKKTRFKGKNQHVDLIMICIVKTILLSVLVKSSRRTSSDSCESVYYTEYRGESKKCSHVGPPTSCCLTVKILSHLLYCNH